MIREMRTVELMQKNSEKLDLSVLSIDGLLSGELHNVVPEFYELRNSVENNNWHHEESTFDHSLVVAGNLINIVNSLSGNLKQYFDAKIDNETRRKLSLMIALFHDIAKPDVIVKIDGKSKCPNHEEVGANKITKLLGRFEISEKEIARIADVIRIHDALHVALNMANADWEQEVQKVREKFKSIYPELVLQSYADTVGGYLQTTRPEEYAFRINFYKNEIESLEMHVPGFGFGDRS
jgi:UTP:GlnB (protein PII) uridylyltransferase